jgi:large subunit ribosomal protein L12
MKHLAAAVLLHLAGKPVDEKGLKSVIEASGQKADDAQVKKVVEALKGKDVLKFAKENIGKVALGGATSAPAVAEAPAKDDKKKDDKKKEAPKKKEPEPDDDDDLGGLF